MSRGTNRRNRRRLGLKRETLRALSLDQLDRVAGGTWGDTEWCIETADCDTSGCWLGTGSRYC